MLMIVRTTSDLYLLVRTRRKHQMNGKQLSECAKVLPHLHELVIRITTLLNINGNQFHWKQMKKIKINTNA